jgi:hypothetical protein
MEAGDCRAEPSFSAESSVFVRVWRAQMPRAGVCYNGFGLCRPSLRSCDPAAR